ncbi:MAG TPA: hypothetical protein VGQ76_12315 [Thermoanaerobaculia bacterium]|jgi:hypothetical protein|nr:hypothetical protein [Thermoanaerobaculia bacterium]
MDISPLPLFPELALLDARVEASELVITLKNVGAFTIRTRTYGQPEYRLIVKLFEGDVQVQDRWLALPRDLEPGTTATIRFGVRQPQLPRSYVGAAHEHAKAVAAATALQTVRLYHALQDVPMLEPEPFAEVRDVR